MRISAIAVLAAFVISFGLPVIDDNPTDDYGWKVAGEVIQTICGSGMKVLERINWSLLELPNLATPLILMMLWRKAPRGRMPVWTAVVMALCAASSGRFVTVPLLVGYWTWWACQVATFGLCIWSRLRPAALATVSAC